MTLLSSNGTVAREYSYAELNAAVAILSREIAARSAPGDRVLILCENSAAFVISFLATLRAGGVAVPAPPSGQHGRLSGIARHCQPKLIMYERTGADADLAMESMFEGEQTLALPSIPDAWIEDRRQEIEHTNVHPTMPRAEMPAVLQYTSGSTTEPKGVVVSHANIMANARTIGGAMSIDDRSVVVSWLPVFHDMGLFGGVMQGLFSGGHTVLMPRLTVIRNPISWLKAISTFQATHSGGPNFVYDLCADALARRPPEEDLDLSSWRVAYNGAEPLHAETLTRFTRAAAPYGFRAEALYPTYGMAEATLFLTGSRVAEVPVVRRFEEFQRKALVSSGRPAPGTQVIIVDEDTKLLRADRHEGEIWVSGPQITERYWNNSQATHETWRSGPDEFADTRFLRTGDLGFLDKGELFVTGRRDDMIVWRGRNFHPQDLERRAIESHPMIEQGCAAAFAIGSGSTDHVVVVVGQRKAGSAKPPDEIAQAVAQAVWDECELALHSVVVVPRAEVQRTSSGKIRRKAMRRAYLANELTILHDGLQNGDGDGSRKWDRDADPRPCDPGQDTETDAGADDQIQAALEELERAASALGITVRGIDPTRPLFASGFDSLALMMLAGYLDERFSDAPEIDLLFNGQARHIASWVARRAQARIPPPPPNRKPAAIPLSREQMAVYVSDRDQWRLVTLLPMVVRASDLERDADAASLLRNLMRRHRMLSARIATRSGKPVFVYPETADSALARRITRLPGPSAPIEQVELALWRAGRTPLPMTGDAPPIRLVIGPRMDDARPILLACHHLVCDARSLGVIQQDIVEILAGRTDPGEEEAALASLVRQEVDLVGVRYEESLAAWTRELAGLGFNRTPPWPMPDAGSHTNDAQSLPARRFRLPAALTAAVRHAALELDAGVPAILLSAWRSTLSALGVPSDQAVTVTAVTPESTGPGAGVGYRVRPFPVRAADGDGATCLRRIAADSRRKLVLGLELSAVSFPQLVGAINPPRSDRYAPFMRYQFGHVRVPNAIMATGRESLDQAPYTAFLLPQMEMVAQVNAQFYESESGIVGMIVHDRETVREDTAQSLTDTFLKILEALTDNWDRPLDQAGTALGQSIQGADAVAGHAAARFEPVHVAARRIARGEPDRIITIDPDDRARNREFWLDVDRLVGRLPPRGEGRGGIIATVLPRSNTLLAAHLAILEAGHAFSPIDPHTPPERIREILEDSSPVAILATAETRALIPAPHPVIDPRLERDGGELDGGEGDGGEAAPLPAPVVARDDPAYVIYTSGSTGRPKGVVCLHGALADRVGELADLMDVAPGDRILSYLSPAFDPSVQVHFMALLKGATTVFAPHLVGFDPPGIVATLNAEAVTHTVAVPSVLREIVDVPAFADCRSLKSITCGGETLSPALRNELVARTDCRLINVYGATETTICATTWDVTTCPDANVSAVGKPMSDTSVMILDPARRLLPPGIIGEIAVGGGALALEYINRPRETEDRFIEDPRPNGRGRVYRTGDLGWLDAHGMLWFAGRRDDQVKINGYRIEPEEVATRLRAQPGVSDSIVVARPADRRGGLVELIAYVCASTPRPPTIGDLNAAMSVALPPAARPSAYVMLDRMPRTNNGKIDRDALPAPAESERVAVYLATRRRAPHLDAPAAAAPDHARAGVATRGARTRRDELVDRIAAVMADILGVSDVPPDESFFSVGGDSLMAIQVVCRLEEVLETTVPTAAFLNAPSANGLAAALDPMPASASTSALASTPASTSSSTKTQEDARAPESDVMCAPLVDAAQYGASASDGGRPPVFLAAPGEKGIEAFRRLAAVLPHDGPIHCLAPPSVLTGRDIGDMHDLARAYKHNIQRLAQGEPAHLVGYSVGGIAAYEAARMIVEGGGRVASLTLIDSPGARWIRIGFLTVLAMNAFMPILETVTRRTADVRYVSLARDERLLTHLRLAAPHRLAPFRESVTMIRAEDGHWLTSLGLGEWRRTCASFRVLTVGGNHSTIFRDPNLQPLAGQLVDIFSKAEVR